MTKAERTEIAELTNYINAKSTDRTFTGKLVLPALRSYLKDLLEERCGYDWTKYEYGCPKKLYLQIEAYRRAIKSFAKYDKEG